MSDEYIVSLGWWTIAGEEIMEMLDRVAKGEDPAMVYAEFYANMDHEYPSEDDDDAVP